MNTALTERSSASGTRSRLRSALGQRAYDHIKLHLLEGELEPEGALSVVKLTQELGCSRVPVMEALKRLESEGFVQIIPQVGCRIVSPAVGDVRDFFVLFSQAEGTMARFASERRSPEDLEIFRAVCREIDDIAATAGPPAARDPTYRRLNLRFHTQIHGMARAPLASKIAASLWDRSDFYIKAAFGSLYFSTRVIRSHREVRAAIIEGDGDTAEREVRAHLLAVGDSVARHLNGSRENP